jgi:hypothetical protein
MKRVKRENESAVCMRACVCAHIQKINPGVGFWTLAQRRELAHTKNPEKKNKKYVHNSRPMYVFVRVHA